MALKINMGQPQRLKNQAERGSDRVKLKEGENVHRILFGPVVVHTVFWPSLQRSEDGEIKSVTKSAKVPDRGSIFEGIAALDRKIQRATGSERPKSQLDKSTKYNYLVIDIDKEPMRVSIAQYPKSVKDRLVEIEEKRDTENPTNLRYGLIWMYNVLITKDVDPNQQKQFGTDYSVEPDPKNPWLGQVPSDWLKTSFGKLVEGKYIDLEEVFSKDMYQALEDADIDLEGEGVPDSEEVIVERLQAFPIDLDGKSFGDKPAFIRPDLLAAELTTLEIPFLPAGEGGGQALLPSQAGKAEEEAAAVDADYEVVDDAPPSASTAAKKLAPAEETGDAAAEEVPSGLAEDKEEIEDHPSQIKSLLGKAKKTASALKPVK